MKKIIFLSLLFACNMSSFAQIEAGIKAGFNYNFSGDLSQLNEITTAADDILHKAENKVGYHGGLWLKLNSGDLFVKTEGVYTQYETSFSSNPTYTIQTQKLDIPIQLGVYVMDHVYVFAGPDFQYILEENFSLEDTDVSYDDFTLGLNLGAGVAFGNLSLELKWDKALSGDNSNISSSIDDNFTLDNRPNQLVFSLLYSLSGKN